MPPLVRTYKSKFLVQGPVKSLPGFEIFQRTKQDIILQELPLQQLPKGSRLLDQAIQSSVRETGDEVVDSEKLDEPEKAIFQLRQTENCDNQEMTVQTWGLPWSVDEFISQAIKAGHPALLDSLLPVRLEECLKKGMDMKIAGRVRHRAVTLKFWLKRLLELRHDEKLFHETIQCDVERVICDKKILIWKEMLMSINYSDMGGTRLTGEAPATGLWPARFTPATMTDDQVRQFAHDQRAAMSYTSVVFFEEDIARAVWDQTLEEAERSEIEGPFELSQVPPHCPLSKRFGVKQGTKIRCVDDFSASSINAAAQTTESPKPHNLDVIAGLLIALMRRNHDVHEWQVRSFDLKSAYRQCAISPEFKDFSWIVVGDPNSRRLKAFKMCALPFGSLRSVHSFLRVANSLWAILTSCFLVMGTNYFDDFVTFADSREAASVDHTVKAVFRMLGRRYAADGPKAPPFSSRTTALGVHINVCELHKGTVLVDNTQARKSELSDCIEKAVGSGCLPRAEALRLRGRMQLAAGQLFGRVARRCLSAVTFHAYFSESANLRQDTICAMNRYKTLLNMQIPRQLTSGHATAWYLYTDACFEPDASEPFSGIGAVLVDSDGRRVRFFSQKLDPVFLERVNVTKRKTIIFECEFLAILFSFFMWKDLLKLCNVVIYTDNDAVRDCLISCNTSSVNAAPILDACLELELQLAWISWFSRVPTESNVADDPSRLETKQLIEQGCLRDHCDYEQMWLRLVHTSGEGSTQH